MRHFFVRTAAVAVLVLGAGLAATPAFAAGTPVQATVDVSQSITMTLNTTSFSISGLAGTTATSAAGAVKEMVTTGDPAGFLVQVTPSGDLSDGHGHTILASALSDNNGVVIPLAETGPTTLVSSTTATPPSGEQFSDTWSVAIPAAAATGSYTTTLTYTAIAN